MLRILPSAVELARGRASGHCNTQHDGPLPQPVYQVDRVAAMGDDCEIIYKVDDDTYYRMLPLINYIIKAWGNEPPKGKYMGLQRGKWDGARPPVITDPANPWYTPLAISATSEGISYTMVPRTSLFRNRYMQDLYAHYMSGAAGWGMSSSPQFNMYKSYRADINGDFCRNVAWCLCA